MMLYPFLELEALGICELCRALSGVGLELPMGQRLSGKCRTG
jgi:hypothetical protein